MDKILDNKKHAIITSQLWDGYSDHVQEGLAVIIHGEVIETTCPASLVPNDIETLHFAEGSTLLPGLIDAHIHYSPWMGPAFLAAGVTTVRDTGNDLDWILAQQAYNQSNILAGPEIVSCGALLDGPNPYWHFIGRGHTDTKSIRKSIRWQAQRGIRFVKFYDGLDLEFIKEGVREAQEHGLWVLADFGTDDPKAEDAVRAGVNEIEHLTGCPAAWHKSSESEKDRLIDVLVDYQVIMTPTLITYDHLGRGLELPFRFDSRHCWVHQTYRDIWRRIPSFRSDARREQREKFQEAALNHKRFTRRLYEREVPIALGTDTPFQFIIPGFSLHDELSMYVDAGIPPVAALRSATSINAALLGLENLVGQLKPGFLANMVVASSNPLECIHNIANIDCVVRRGVILPTHELKERSDVQGNQKLNDPFTRDLLRYLNSIQTG